MGKYSFTAGIFDMDGVITKTAIVHADAWKLVFDEYLHIIEKRENKPFQEFTHQDYLNYVDGKPRLKGIASFLESRGITLPLGTDKDTLKDETIYAIGNIKNEKFRNVLETKGVQLYEPTVQLIKDLKANGMKVGVVSSSKNCEFVLKSAGVLDLFDTRVDGVIAGQLGLEGKPEGDIFTKAAENLGTTAAQSIVFEDAISGVQSGRNGGFGLVVGIARSDNIKELNDNGADVVVTSLSMMTLDLMEKWFCKKPLSLLGNWDKELDAQSEDIIFKDIKGELEINPIYLSSSKQACKSFKKTVLFLPETLTAEDSINKGLIALSKKMTVVVYSDKPCVEVSKAVGLETIYFLGRNGFTIFGEQNNTVELENEIKESGELVRWFLKAAQISWDDSKVIYIGNQIKGENAFRMVNTRGMGIIISQGENKSSAQFYLESVAQLEQLMNNIIESV